MDKTAYINKLIEYQKSVDDLEKSDNKKLESILLKMREVVQNFNLAKYKENNPFELNESEHMQVKEILVSTWANAERKGMYIPEPIPDLYT